MNYSCIFSFSSHQVRATETVEASADETALLEILGGSTNRGKALSVAELSEVHRLAAALEASTDGTADTNDSPLLPGRWRVLYQGKPGTSTPFFSLDSWRAYLGGDGPSPIQNLVSSSSGVSRLYQILDLGEGGGGGGGGGRVNNVVDFSPTGVIAIEAQYEGRLAPSRLGFRFSGGRVLLRTLWNGTLAFPYPVPFGLLGDNAKGWLQTDYLTENLRLSRGNKGSLFVLVPEAEPDDPELEALLDPPPPPPAAAADEPAASAPTLDPVIVCPAQFGTENDYAELVAGLRARGHPVYVAPLIFTDWLRLIPASLTAEYWRGELSPDVALPFYYEALDKATKQVAAEHPDKPIQLVAHSIGGWIARAYLGQLDDNARAAFGALVTLGTPHAPPPKGIFRTLDQVRVWSFGRVLPWCIFEALKSVLPQCRLAGYSASSKGGTRARTTRNCATSLSARARSPESSGVQTEGWRACSRRPVICHSAARHLSRATVSRRSHAPTSREPSSARSTLFTSHSCPAVARGCSAHLGTARRQCSESGPTFCNDRARWARFTWVREGSGAFAHPRSRSVFFCVGGAGVTG
jgi:hypothetical protein